MALFIVEDGQPLDNLIIFEDSLSNFTWDLDVLVAQNYCHTTPWASQDNTKAHALMSALCLLIPEENVPCNGKSSFEGNCF